MKMIRRADVRFDDQVMADAEISFAMEKCMIARLAMAREMWEDAAMMMQTAKWSLDRAHEYLADHRIKQKAKEQKPAKRTKGRKA